MTRSELLEKISSARLYAILDTGYSNPRLWPELTRKIILGGAGIIQIRAKNCTTEQIISWTRTVQPVTESAKVPLIINDHPELVAPCSADGCHVGQDDLSVAEVRKITGPEAIVGKSTHSLDQAIAGQAEGADYIGFGPIFATPTKPDYIPIGPDAIQAMSRQITLPAFCIGGIKKENVARLAALGARRIVIVSGLLQATDPETYAREALLQLN